MPTLNPTGKQGAVPPAGYNGKLANSETVFVVVNENGTVRSTGGYRYEQFSDLGLYELIKNFAFSDAETAQEKADYVNAYEKYAPGEEYHDVATDREKKMARRAKEGFHVEEIEIEYSMDRS